MMRLTAKICMVEFKKNNFILLVFENLDETSLSYDKQIVTTVFVVIVGTILMAMILTLALCFCKSKQKLTETFMAIFGNF